jgi:hypothetical protein
METKEIVETRTTRLAEFLATGDWIYHSHYMVIGKIANVDGRLEGVDGGEIIGEIVGEDPMTCAYCGYGGLMDNFAIQDRKTGRILTLGSKCIEHIDNDAEVAKMKGVMSLRRKVNADFKRKIHHEQMLDFLNEHLEELSAPRKQMVKDNLAKNPQHYWLDESHVVETKSGKQIEVKRTQWERSHNAEQLQNKDENYWELFINDFKVKCWNPKTMQPVIQEKIDKDGLDIKVPKLRKLTDEEKIEMNRQIKEQIDAYLERVK